MQKWMLNLSEIIVYFIFTMCCHGNVFVTFIFCSLATVALYLKQGCFVGMYFVVKHFEQSGRLDTTLYK